MAILTREVISDWLKAQSASERSFQRALRRFFFEQAARVADAATGIDLTPAMVPLFFHADAEHARLMPIVRRNIAGMMVAGAKSELAALERRRKRRKSTDEISPYDPEYAEHFGLDASDLQQFFWEGVPARIKQRIRHAVDESTSQPYWRAVQDNVSGNIGDIIKTGIDDGISGREMANRIADEMEADGIDRAMNIATTESTGALNAGHDAAIENAAESGDGEIVGREWLSISDDSTRETHVDANGQIVPVGQPFNVGGYECDYPGDWSLPPEERCRCRCTVVAAFDE